MPVAIGLQPGDFEPRRRQWVPIDVDHTHVFVDWYLPSSEPNEWEKKLFAEHAAGVFAEDIPI